MSNALPLEFEGPEQAQNDKADDQAPAAKPLASVLPLGRVGGVELQELTAFAPPVAAPVIQQPPASPLLRLRRIARQWPSLLYLIVSLGTFLALWHFATKYRIDWFIRFTNIPSPAQVYEDAMVLAKADVFYTNMGISVRRVVSGFGIATMLGITLGLLIGRFRPVRGVLLPVIEVLRPIPAIAWVPMSIMLWPSNETSIVFITFLGAFFPILLNTVHGVNSVDPVLIRAARSLGASEFKLLYLVVLKSALPHIFTGLSVGMGVAWVSLIAAEMISGQFGIGYFTWEAYSLVEYSHIVVGMVLIGILGLLCSGIIHVVGGWLTPWVRLQGGGR